MKYICKKCGWVSDKEVDSCERCGATKENFEKKSCSNSENSSCCNKK